MTASRTTLRCAVYTRKSSEEGLDMAFNSLDAQREAGLDYIRSQKHQGWTAITAAYDDGGFSGGTIERPALQRLLADIDAGRVDVVVVYKVDRLSRSLADFARLMQCFDERGVSFVSVTQQFSTTTSMGRLTLNMLLSFAQFEREVAGERIRDKIAATKRKGVWVCGQPPLGYRLPMGDELRDRVLRIVPEEANVVRAVYAAYLACRSLLEVARRLNAGGFTTKRWVSTRARSHGGIALSKEFVYRVLTNPIYVGKVTHTRRIPPSPGRPRGESITEVHDGLHRPIIERSVWARVQTTMTRIKRGQDGRSEAGGWTHTHLLKGLLKTAEGRAMSPSHVAKRRGKTGERTRVPYYVSQKAIKEGYGSCPIKSVNARIIDDLVRGLVAYYLHTTRGVVLPDDPAERDAAVRGVIERVVLVPDAVAIEVDAGRVDAISAGLERAGRGARPACSYAPAVEERGATIALTLRVKFKRLNRRCAFLGPDGLPIDPRPAGGREPNVALVSAFGRAYAWHREIQRTGETIRELAKRIGEHPQRIHNLLPLTQLGPRVVRSILTGETRQVSLLRLVRMAKGMDWTAQTTGHLLTMMHGEGGQSDGGVYLVASTGTKGRSRAQSRRMRRSSTQSLPLRRKG